MDDGLALGIFRRRPLMVTNTGWFSATAGSAGSSFAPTAGIPGLALSETVCNGGLPGPTV
jgi:hypothetical protein